MSVSGQTTRGEVTIRNLSKSYSIKGRRLNVLQGVSNHIRSGESLAIVGASGSGKTTLLRVLAGLEEADRGEVLIDGHPIRGVGTDRAVIFQEPRLLPWQTVLDNVAFPLENRGLKKTEARNLALHYVNLVGLGDFAEALPSQLSGGMAQRVGIARALAVKPEILLLDEPFGALDAMTKITMQEELSRIWREEKVTMILVTHDLEEAIYLADRVLILSNEKEGRTREIEIDLPRPRHRSEPRFVRFREQLLNEFGLH
ncbi:ABC transporter ATP-binding protein [Agrobacterium rhizogenes]|uniref:ABC transporter ATP-binding protein n=1 Tax=Rhizobium rhizogenes TaxID=359 RepID=UPI00115E8D54|nr:ABC transporter ATP-binding protein [Rhizobium rhizogenes]NTG04982.1 ABC transporter ATP-binding protein [Rhizobium rhizogenes]NTG32310.1 ABC transporter ATP-binding protein [Rhizobium rhizogenes]NTG38777.1 ABC transporter ATP-binding protein [Rhizobium rhizogenes]NTG58584.1 ABC transporter ATP-binding protein [Rhizobium rhizogenes]QCL09457.1 ABC transporter family protein [Rhizobium rhizogenes]